MKYTRSEDGKLRCTLHVKIRCTEEELAEMREAAKENGDTLHQWLSWCLIEGIGTELMDR